MIKAYQSPFSAKFFHWLDKPVCANCGTKTVATGPVQPTADDLKWHAGRVEGFKCPKCGKYERFPRYNHPGKLLGKLYLFITISCVSYFIVRVNYAVKIQNINNSKLQIFPKDGENSYAFKRSTP